MGARFTLGMAPLLPLKIQGLSSFRSSRAEALLPTVRKEGSLYCTVPFYMGNKCLGSPSAVGDNAVGYNAVLPK